MNERRTAVTAQAVHLPVLTQFLQEFCLDAQLPPAQIGAFELALEEVFINIAMHGSQPGMATRVELSLALATTGLTMTVEDDGPQFDPLSLPPPALAASLAERRVGGLGVFLVRQMMDAVSYQRIGGRNRLCMTKSLSL